MAINTLAVVQSNGLYTDEYWEKRLLGMIAIEQKEMVFTNLGIKRTIPLNQGNKTFTMRRYLHLPVDLTEQLLAEGVAPEALKVEGQKVSGTVNQYGARIEVTDVAEDIHFDNIRDVYQPELARHASEVIERDVMASFTEASEYYVGSKVSKETLVAGDILTLADARRVALQMRVNLRKGHPKAGGKPLVVVRPEVMQDLLDDDTLETKMLATGMENTPIKNGSLRGYTVYDLAFQESLMAEVELVTFAPVQTPASANVYTSYMIGSEAYMVLNLGNLSWHNVPFKATWGNELGQKASVGYKLWTGAKVIDPMALILIYSRSAYDVVDSTATDLWAQPASQV
jgi:hypothetical protein